MLEFIKKVSTGRHSQPARAEDGQTLVEYALIIGVVAVGLVVSLTTLKSQIETLFTTVSTALGAAVPGG